MQRQKVNELLPALCILKSRMKWGLEMKLVCVHTGKMCGVPSHPNEAEFLLKTGFH